MKKYSILFWITILALGVILYLIGNIGADDSEDVDPTPTPTVEATNTPTPIPTSTPTPIIYNPTPTPAVTPDGGNILDGFPDQSLSTDTPPRSAITGPATCQLSGGTIHFFDKNTAIHDNAYIAYQNVDHPGRLLFWNVSNDDGVLNIGPNIFDGLYLPGGQQNLTVLIEGEPKYKTYTLTVQINYGIEHEDGGIIDTAISDCTGEITVELDYLK